MEEVPGRLLLILMIYHIKGGNMKKLLFVLLFLAIGCWDDTDYLHPFYECYLPGDTICENNIVLECGLDYLYWTKRDCSVIGMKCVFNQPELQDGYTYIATCEELDE